MAGDGVLTQVIDPASDRAVYKQIADHLRDAIGRRRLREGEQLPSEAQLMEHYGVARMTIRNALRVLQDEGLTTAEHGRVPRSAAWPRTGSLSGTARRARQRSTRRLPSSASLPRWTC
jgi:GntR family transcriptional regulator